jgi:Cu-Zn family superoxide dismutase
MGNNNSYQFHNSYVCDGRNAVCVLDPKNGIHGTVEFHQCSPNGPVKVRIEIEGESRKTHAIHIHEFGDTRDGCKSLGLHHNPYGHTHGSRHYNMPRHAGDLINNFTFNSNGYFKHEYSDDLLTMYNNDKKDISIVGRSIVIHEGQDDLGLGMNKESLISGNAGNRINCGVIGVCKLRHF